MTNQQACYSCIFPPPGRGGNKIKGFGNGEENQRVEKPKTKKYRRYHTYGSTKM